MNSPLEKQRISEQVFSLPYGDEVIRYSVAIRPNDNGKVLIKVHDDGRVVAHAPVSADLVAIRTAMQKRAGWVWRQLSAFRQYQHDIQPRQYISGESHFYLGRRYLLKVECSDSGVTHAGGAQGVKLTRGRFEVYLNNSDKIDNRAENKIAVKKQLERWYQTKAGDVFQRRLQALLPQISWVERAPELRWQKMRKQWGSCSADNMLMLNTHLVKAPRDCIDYVILHELCHIRERNHGASFYQLLKTIMPDWEARKAYLDQHAFAFLA